MAATEFGAAPVAAGLARGRTRYAIREHDECIAPLPHARRQTAGAFSLRRSRGGLRVFAIDCP